MTRDRDMDADLVGELRECESGTLAQASNAPVDWAVQSLPRSPHASVLDRRSTFRKTLSTTHLLPRTGRLSSMGDARHKRSPRTGTPRAVTPLFVKQVIAALAANEVHNAKHGLKKGDPGYLPASNQDIADETGADPNQVKNMLGGVRPGTKIKKVGKSKYVDPICDLLGIERLVRVEVEVPARVADMIRALAALPPDAIVDLDAEIRKRK